MFSDAEEATHGRTADRLNHMSAQPRPMRCRRPSGHRVNVPLMTIFLWPAGKVAVDMTMGHLRGHSRHPIRGGIGAEVPLWCRLLSNADPGPALFHG